MLASLAFQYLGVSLGVAIAALIFLVVQRKVRARYSAVSLSVIWIAMACCLLFPMGSLLLGGQAKAPLTITVSDGADNHEVEPLPTPAAEDDAALSQSPAAVIEQSPVPPAGTLAPEMAGETAFVSIDWSRLFGTLWLIGVLLFTGYQGVCYARLRRFLRLHAVDCPENVVRMLESVRRELSIRRPVRLVYAPCNSPYLVGLFHPMIVLPQNGSASLPLEFVLKHELTHLANHDIFLKLLALFANALHFYNPMAYVIHREIALSRELVCDERALQGHTEPYVHAYGNAILVSLLTTRQTGLTTQFGGTKEQMKERLSHMLHFRDKKKGVALAAGGLVVTVAACLVFGFNMGSNVAAQGEGGSSTQSDTTAGDGDVVADVVSINDAASAVSDIAIQGNTKAITNIMLIGLDDDEKDSFQGRSDCMILLTINRVQKTIRMTSLMRDTYVTIPNRGGGKLNAAVALGGYDLLSETIAANFRITVDRYVAVNFSAFSDAVEAMHGVELALTSEEAAIVGVGTTAGSYPLNGDQAVSYACIRKLDSDFGRTERQRKLMSALFNRAKSMDIVTLLNTLKAIVPTMQYNLTKNEWISYLRDVPVYLQYDITQNHFPRQEEAKEQNMNEFGSVLAFKDATKSVLELQHRLYE